MQSLLHDFTHSRIYLPYFGFPAKSVNGPIPSLGRTVCGTLRLIEHTEALAYVILSIPDHDEINVSNTPSGHIYKQKTLF
jgi:hypothetical protein